MTFIQKSIEILASQPFPCPNCDTSTADNKSAVFCSELCNQAASVVRYFRRKIAQNQVRQDDIHEALQIKVAWVLAGGYPRKEREVPPSIRAEVIARAGSRCQRCSEPGTDVDHIKGSSNDLANLQYLCKKCHNEKTVSGLKPISPENQPKLKLLLERARSPIPLRICDSDEWERLWPRIQRAKRDGAQQSLFR